MKVNVTKNAVSITEYNQINSGECGVNICEFQLPEEFSSLTVTASFNNIPVPVCDGECIIPTLKKGTAVLGVYAYKENAEGVELMYSPKPTAFYVNEGSYSDEIGREEMPSLSDYEKICKSFTDSVLKEVGDREKTTNKTVIIDESSTDEQYPSAKAVYELFADGSASGDMNIGILTEINPTGEHASNEVYNANVMDDVLLTFDETLTTLGDDLNSAQPKLISGENIKTLNGESVLGEGNIDIIGADAFEMKTVSSSNLLDASTKENGMIHTDGKFYNYENYRCFGFMPVSPGDVLSLQWEYNNVRYWSVSDNGANGFFQRVAAYDANKTILTGLGAVSSGSDKVFSYEVPEGVAYVRITFGSTIDVWDNIAVVKNASGIIPYQEYGAQQVFLKKEALPLKEPLVFMPDEIACAVGRTIEIYNSQVCPLADKYHIKWDCAVGRALKRKFSITGSENLVGEYPLSLTVYDDDLKVVYRKEATLRITEGLSKPMRICAVGDSLTNGKYWLNEVRALSSSNISFVGTRGVTDGLKHEGRSGFTAKAYLNNTEYSFENEGVHPFWDSNNNKFSWEYYKNTTGINPDGVQIFLGTNDLAGSLSADAFALNIKQMVDSIREGDTNIPVYITLTICWGNQDGIGVQTSSDGFASQKGKFKYEMDDKIIKGVRALYNKLKDYDKLYFIPLTQCHDSEFNFGNVEAPVNPRAVQTELVPVEAIHPQKQGYEQMADVIYSVISLHN